jgi:drug/metabolite transporter (DMT)-like permease
MSIFQTGEFWALSAGILWSVAVVLFRRAGEEAAPLPLNLFKNVVGLVFFVPLLALAQVDFIPAWPAEVWLRVALSGLLGITLADTMFFMALNRLGAGLVAVVDCLYFPIMVLMAYWFLGEAVTLAAVVGGGLVVLGILIGSLERPPGGASKRDIAEGVVIGSAGMVFVGLGVMLIDELLNPDQVLAATTFRLLFGTAALVPLVLAGPDRSSLRRLASPTPWWRTAVPASVLGGALAMLAWLNGFALTSVASAAILNQLSTIWIFVLAAAFLQEPMTRRRVLAVILAMAGVVLVVMW